MPNRVPGRLFGNADVAAALAGLRGLPVNYDPAEAPSGGRPRAGWHVDSGSTVVGREPPGPPGPGGPWELACEVVRRYEFTDPGIVRAVYRIEDDLLGRDMLLEGRFFGLRFYLGVRVTGITDDVAGAGPRQVRRWGWSYQTLQGHLEQGQLSYRVDKRLATGEVVFRVSGYSRRAPIPNPVIRQGFKVFGRPTQVRFYASVQRRLRELVEAAGRGEPPPEPTVREDGLAIAPSGATPHPLEWLARSSHHPGA